MFVLLDTGVHVSVASGTSVQVSLASATNVHVSDASGTSVQMSLASAIGSHFSRPIANVAEVAETRPVPNLTRLMIADVVAAAEIDAELR